MRRVRKSMRLNTRTVVLFSTLVVLFIGLMGCFPQPRPDTTPPVVDEVLVSQINPNPVEKGLPVDVTVKVTATDQRSNLKHTEITLFAKLEDAPDTAYRQVATAVVAFPAQRSATVQHEFTVPTDAAPFDTAGSFVFQARATAEDIRGNKSAEAVRSAASGLVVNPSRDPQPPVISEPVVTGHRINESLFRVWAGSSVNVSVTANDQDGDLQHLKLEVALPDRVETDAQTSEGTDSLTASLTGLVFNIEEQLRTFPATATAQDAEHEPVVYQFWIQVNRQGVQIIEETHLGVSSTARPGLPEMHWGRYPATAVPADVTGDPIYETPPNYTLPFGITTLKFDFNVAEIIPGKDVKLYIYSRPSDLFSEDAQFMRGEGQVYLGPHDAKHASIRFANISFDDAKWLALKVEGLGANPPWFVWKIAAADHAPGPEVTLDYFGTIEEFIEGKPINVTVRLKDEMLLTMNDFQIRYQDETGRFTTLEELIRQLNLHVEAGAADSTIGWRTEWRYAIRYHVKATYEDFDEANDAIRIRDMDPNPDPKTVYAISRPHMGLDPNPAGFATEPIHRWYRFGETATNTRALVDPVNANRLWETNVPVDFIYFFGVPDRQVEQYNHPVYITEMATMNVSIYGEIVVVDMNDPDNVIFVGDGALGAGNRYILETAGGYKQYDLRFAGKNVADNWGVSETKIFPIYADNTSPSITVNYGPLGDQKVFIDRRPHRLSTGAFDRIAVPMFYADTVRVKAGQEITIKAEDDVALYDFFMVHANRNVQQDWNSWRNNLPPIINPTQVINMPMGFDFLYSRRGLDQVDQIFYEGLVPPYRTPADVETLPLRTLNQIFSDEPNPIISKSLYTNIYNRPFGNFSIDPHFEFYANYTWSGVRDANIARIDPVLQEQYFTMRTTTDTKTVVMPSIPGTYWVWVVARDRGAQDSYLFDYIDRRVNIDPLTGNTRIYDQDVQLHQNNRFIRLLNLEDPNVFYENSESEADAPMVVLLRVIVETHSMDIQRLDIREPDLVSYPNTRIFQGREYDVWYAHSYNVLQLDQNTKIAEFDPNEPRELLPHDMYPVYKRVWADHDAGSRFGVNSQGQVSNHNLWNAVETNRYGGIPLDDPLDVPPGNVWALQTFEAVPVVGGPNPTSFRVKTHEDIEHVVLEFVEGEIWTVEDYAFHKPTVVATKVIDKDKTTTKHEGKGMGGYWVWEIDWEDMGLIGVEATHTLVVKALHIKQGSFWEQWQWPVFVDTLGPRIRLYNAEGPVYREGDLDPFDRIVNAVRANTLTQLFNKYYKVGELDPYDPANHLPVAPMPYGFFLAPVNQTILTQNRSEALNNVIPRLEMRDEIPQGRTMNDAYYVRSWTSMLVKDQGGIFFEHQKGWAQRQNPTLVDPPAIDWRLRMQQSRGADMQAHSVLFRAGDSSNYPDYSQQDLQRKDLYSHMLGFPGLSDANPLQSIAFPNLDLTPYELFNSLKYMNHQVDNVAFWNWSMVLDERLRPYMNEIYSRNLDKDYHGSLPTRALFHNIDFEKYIWRFLGDMKLALSITLTDELGNQGTWESYVRKLVELFRISASIAKAFVNSRDDRLNINVQSDNLAEQFYKLEIVEMPHLDITTTLPPTILYNQPNNSISTFSLNNRRGLLVPAWQEVRSLQVIAEGAIGVGSTTVELLNTLNPGASTFAGNPPEIGLRFLPDDLANMRIVDMHQFLLQEGRTDLVPLVKMEDRWIAKGFTGLTPFTISAQISAYDDNVDRYEVLSTAVPNTLAGLDPDVSAPTWNQLRESDGVVTWIDTATLRGNANPALASQYGYVTFNTQAWDCPGMVPIVQNLKIWFSNPQTFVVSITPEGLTGSGYATGVEIIFQHDILFGNEAEIINNVFPIYNGVQLTPTHARQWDVITNAWVPITGAGRNNRFLLTVNPFMPVSSRELRAVFNGVRFSRVYSTALGNLSNVEYEGNVNHHPEILAVKVNGNPVHRAGLITVNEGVATITATVRDNDGDPLTVSVDVGGLKKLEGNALGTIVPVDVNLPTPLSPGNFEIMIRATDGKVAESYGFRVRVLEVQGPSAPEYIQPEDESSVSEEGLQLQWRQSTSLDPDSLEYDLYLSQDVAEVNTLDPVAKKDQIEEHFDTDIFYFDTGFLGEGIWFWRVVARDSIGQTPGPVWSFEVKSMDDFIEQDALPFLKDLPQIMDAEWDLPNTLGARTLPTLTITFGHTLGATLGEFLDTPEFRHLMSGLFPMTITTDDPGDESATPINFDALIEGMKSIENKKFDDLTLYDTPLERVLEHYERITFATKGGTFEIVFRRQMVYLLPITDNGNTIGFSVRASEAFQVEDILVFEFILSPDIIWQDNLFVLNGTGDLMWNSAAQYVVPYINANVTLSPGNLELLRVNYGGTPGQTVSLKLFANGGTLLPIDATSNQIVY